METYNWKNSYGKPVNIGDSVFFKTNDGKESVMRSALLSKIINEYTIEVNYNGVLFLLDKAEVSAIVNKY